MTYKETDESDAGSSVHPFPTPGIGCFKERLRECISSQSLRGFSKECGLSEATLRSYLSGDTYPTLDRLELIAKAANASAEWLAFGDRSAQAESAQGNDEYAFVPVRNVEVSAGSGSAVMDEDVASHVAFRRNWLQRKGLNVRSLSCVYARGDSMDPLICNDNLLLVDQTKTTIGEGIYVLRIEDQLFVKRLQLQLGGGVGIISENPAYDNQVVPKANLGELHVIGRVVWCARDM